MTERQLEVTRLSDVEPASPAEIRAAYLIRETVRRVLPADWHVLLNGCSVPSLLAKQIMDALEQDGLTVTVHPRPCYCQCGHSEASHDIGRDGTRTACSHIAGPRGTRCPCKRFAES